ncbi:MAG: alpha-amylase family glycosyl hydrolase [Bacteroidales bacterium]|nr:alpha-amylase family glycosyl hydrolase [Bacteroidales bacterium]MDZ4203439.1 alpha-amylase family glycosyl hydrolase [Bacteroidales bacterium]
MSQQNKKIIIYQVLVRLFGNKNQSSKPFGTIHENGCGKFNDISDIALESLKTLSITHIWYTGVIAHATTADYSRFGIPRDHAEIVKGRAGSPYAIKDYFDVDPDLADNVLCRMQEFQNLVDRTHQTGLKVIIDFVPNHVSREYCGNARPEGVKDLGVEDISTLAFHPQNNFYYLPGQHFVVPKDGIPHEMEPLPEELWEPYIEFPAKVTGNDCFSAQPTNNDWYETIKLNYGVEYPDNDKTHFNPPPATWERMREILLFWANKGVDGFRCDMAGMVPVEFWNWVIPVVKRSYPALLFIAEIYEPNNYHRFLDQGQFDYLYDKVGLYDILRHVVEGKLPASDISLSWQNLDGLDDRMLRFLENHDEQRIASKHIASNPCKAIPAMVAVASMNSGPVMLYFGQEVGEPADGVSGYSGDDGRTTVFDYFVVPELQKWINKGAFDGGLLKSWQHNLRNFYIRLFNLCQEHDPFYRGDFYDLMWVNRESLDEKHLYAYLRYTENECLLVVLNFGDKPQKSARVHIPQHAFDLLQQFPEASLNINRMTMLDANEILWKLDEISFTVAQAIDEGVPVSLKPHSAVIFSF